MPVQCPKLVPACRIVMREPFVMRGVGVVRGVPRVVMVAAVMGHAAVAAMRPRGGRQRQGKGERGQNARRAVSEATHRRLHPVAEAEDRLVAP